VQYPRRLAVAEQRTAAI